jgi:hypothetical protein
MSRSKRPAATRVTKESRNAGHAPHAADAAPTGRVGPARRRAQVAKIVVAAVAAVGFSVCLLLARLTYAGHAKHPVRALSIPQPLYEVVRRNLLQAGIMAPATAPPDATTSTS